MPERLVDRVRARIEEIRTRGLIPTARTRVEEIVTQVKERVSGAGGGLTRETTKTTVGGGKRIIRGL